MRLFVFGIGYSSLACIHELRGECSWIAGTTRSTEKMNRLRNQGINAFLFDGKSPNHEITEALKNSTHILVSIPPDENGDSVLASFGESLVGSEIEWIGYLSTVGVYGDHSGNWVDENSKCQPKSARSKFRIDAELKWQEFGQKTNTILNIFRLSGIYGPGRNAFVNIERGRARRLIKPGQVFNRIFVDDIAGAVSAAVEKSTAGTFNVTDDKPCPPQDVVTFAAKLMNVDPPPAIKFEEAGLSPMARSFYSENKRVSNQKLKSELGYQFRYPDFRLALEHLKQIGWN